MRKVALSFILALSLAGSALSQPMGSVQGIVLLVNGTPAAGAQVWLSGVGGSGYMPHHHFRSLTDPNGHFGFPSVPPGPYNISAAARMEHGHSSEIIEVLMGQTTNITLTLRDGDSTGHHDSLAIVILVGTAVVIHPDTAHPLRTFYLLDVDQDLTPDYRLSFGPPWYNPPSGAQRPVNGDIITIVGGLLTYGDPPLIVVFSINGLPWREAHRGEHGGDCGNVPFIYNGCDGFTATSDPEHHSEPELVELRGTVEIPTCLPPPVNPPGVFQFRVERSEDIVFINCGVDYTGIPGDGWQMVYVVGGLIPAHHDSDPWIVVYEINGEFIREPGDTTNLANPTAIDDPILPTIPVSYITASNYPNPFNPETTIRYSIPVSGDVELKVFDIAGREISTLVNGHQTAGTHTAIWTGDRMPSGIYLFRIGFNDATVVGRMVLLK